MTIHEKAESFRSLHTGGPLVLPNAWDVATALLVAEAGASAVATTSAGVAWSLGTADGGHLDRGLAVDAIARIAAAVEQPVTADIEHGYAETPDGVAATVRLVLEAGAVGVNIEDSVGRALRPVREQAERVAAARAAADAVGIPMFINARTDPFLLAAHDDQEQRLRDALARARAYADAGADGIFVPGTTDLTVIGELARGIDRPLNVMAGPGAPAVAELATAGAARISIGPRLAQAAYALARQGMRELLTDGTYHAMAGSIDFAELNALYHAKADRSAIN